MCSVFDALLEIATLLYRIAVLTQAGRKKKSEKKIRLVGIDGGLGQALTVRKELLVGKRAAVKRRSVLDEPKGELYGVLVALLQALQGLVRTARVLAAQRCKNVANALFKVIVAWARANTKNPPINPVQGRHTKERLQKTRVNATAYPKQKGRSVVHEKHAIGTQQLTREA